MSRGHVRRLHRWSLQYIVFILDSDWANIFPVERVVGSPIDKNIKWYIPDPCASAPYLQHLKIWTLNSKNKRVRAISRHLISFLKNIFDLHWFSEQMTFSKENKKQKQFPLKINENAVFKNQKTVSIENPNKCQGWIFFLNFFNLF